MVPYMKSHLLNLGRVLQLDILAFFLLAHMNNTAHIAYWKQIALLQAILQSKLESCLMFQFYQLFRLDEASFIATFLAQFI